MKPARPGSIVRRLLLASIVTLPLFLGITGYSIDRAHSRSLVDAQRSQLQLQFYGILGVMEWSNTQAISVERLREPRFWQFRSGLYAFIHSSSGLLQWQSSSANSMEFLRDAYAKTPPGEEAFDNFSARGEEYFRYSYHVIWEDEYGVDFPLIFTLLSSQETYKAELFSFRKNIALWLGLAGILLLAIQLLVLRWGLAPMGRLARELRDLESGGRQHLSQRYPKELTGITRNLNRLLDKELQQRERYRNTLADLAHSLKTPLSVLRLSSSEKPDPVVDEQLNKMENIISYQLQRAVSTGPRTLGSKTALQPVLKRLLNSLDKVYRDKSLQFQLQCDSALSLAVDEQDLMELFGNILDNACKAAQSRVAVSAVASEGSNIEICIDDDGPGFPDDKAELLMQRGYRGDQYGSGQGLGLSMVADIILAYEARLEVEKSPQDGARLRLILPA
ncbi:MAG TPA: two-component sensor histidine kinase [Spongiibacteraceae bacterium]|nr:two-component sensor histidine kinase [Spongiibacteraceae bacterium]MBN51722.1 two-component sensor histidine kinase [Spongiibacteraceae bacterium]HCS27949.1 two-component sensor histidine kinase [Spongiibacteraceae bacterium]|tara:strand:+ start:875 stop:2218 length:1344 start_codon:yes stop_codon:yes gene_type:complete